MLPPTPLPGSWATANIISINYNAVALPMSISVCNLKKSKTPHIKAVRRIFNLVKG